MAGKEVWKEMRGNFIMKTKFMMVTSNNSAATGTCTVYTVHCIVSRLHSSFLCQCCRCFAVFFHHIIHLHLLSLSFSPFDHTFWLSCQKAIVVCVTRAKKSFFFFKNQVNDECKVGHFADTQFTIKQNTLCASVCECRYIVVVYLQESVLLCFSQPLLHTTEQVLL